MKKSVAICAVVTMILTVSGIAPAVTIETVRVGDAGNAADTRYATPGYGAVPYEYNIGKYEVTAGQYTAFLNAVAAMDTYGLYNTSMWTDSDGCRIQQSGSPGSYSYTVASDYANRPVNWVSFWDSCRFANWLGNGQGSSSTETGAYTLTVTGIANNTITRNTGATWVITSEDEWYKAAYYKGGSTNAGYWDYPTSSDNMPGRDLSDASGNNANWYGTPYPIDSPYYTTVVGEFQNSDSPYGTFDQGGNIWEWTEAVPRASSRGLRGASFGVSGSGLLASMRGDYDPAFEYSHFGFRVSQVPEPASMAVLVLGGIGLLRRRRNLGR